MGSCASQQYLRQTRPFVTGFKRFFVDFFREPSYRVGPGPVWLEVVAIPGWLAADGRGEDGPESPRVLPERRPRRQEQHRPTAEGDAAAAPAHLNIVNIVSSHAGRLRRFYSPEDTTLNPAPPLWNLASPGRYHA